MAKYEKYSTTVVGSYSVPRWYEALEKQVESGALSKEDMADAQRIMVEAEKKLRDIALAAYLESQDKHPGPGVEIKIRAKLDYDPVKALEWAKEHGLALMLNVRSFEALAKANPIPCVTSEPEPKATLATDMRKALQLQAEDDKSLWR